MVRLWFDLGLVACGAGVCVAGCELFVVVLIASFVLGFVSGCLVIKFGGWTGGL